MLYSGNFVNVVTFSGKKPVGRSQWSQGHALGPSGRNSKSLPTQNWKMQTLRWLALCVSDARSAASLNTKTWDPSMVHTKCFLRDGAYTSYNENVRNHCKCLFICVQLTLQPRADGHREEFKGWQPVQTESNWIMVVMKDMHHMHPRDGKCIDILETGIWSESIKGI